MARVFISSPDGKQLTLKRILPGDVYTFGISGLLDPPGPLSIETESACEFLVIPRSVCRELCGSPAVKDVLIREMQHRFSQVLRIMESVAFSGMGARLANELIEQSHFASSSMFAITHERIAADLGTAREVVTRLLNQFQQDGVVALLRGRIEILKMKELIQIRGEYLGEVSRTIYPDLY
jgi:CRP/FNR family transcriptional regulator